MAETDPTSVGLCLDTGHHTFRGGDPVALTQKHAQSLEYLYMNNFDREKLAEINARVVLMTMEPPRACFASQSMGAVDFIFLRQAPERINYEGFAIVEQDMYLAPLDKPLAFSRRTRGYLREIVFG